MQHRPSGVSLMNAGRLGASECGQGKSFVAAKLQQSSQLSGIAMSIDAIAPLILFNAPDQGAGCSQAAHKLSLALLVLRFVAHAVSEKKRANAKPVRAIASPPG